jgi:peptidoglycan/LPS O-acetylase OafA/YrhL
MAFFAILYGVKFMIPEEGEITPLINLFLAVSGIFAVMNISMRIDKTTNPVKSLLVKLSFYSYTIYLFHTTAEGFAKSVFHKIPLENYLMSDLCFVFKAFFIIAFGVVIPVIFHKIVVSKSRLLSFLIGVKYSQKK